MSTLCLGEAGRRPIDRRLGDVARLNYYPSANPFADLAPDLQAQTVGQDRFLTNAGVRSSISYVKGIHNLKAGVDFAWVDNAYIRIPHHDNVEIGCRQRSAAAIRGTQARYYIVSRYTFCFRYWLMPNPKRQVKQSR